MIEQQALIPMSRSVFSEAVLVEFHYGAGRRRHSDVQIHRVVVVAKQTRLNESQQLTAQWNIFFYM